MDSPAEKKHAYRVLVDDNFHYMDASERYEHGRYDTCERAIEESKRIVDEFLVANHRASMTSAELWQKYLLFGDDPFIVSQDNECRFSAWDYARQRCQELCQPPTSHRQEW